MARTPSMTVAEAEAQIGPRPVHVDGTNRPLLRKWLVAKGFPASFVCALSMVELAVSYNEDTAKVQKKFNDFMKDFGEDEEPVTVATHADVRTMPVTNGHANGHDTGDAAKLVALLRSTVGGAVDEQRVREVVCETMQPLADELRKLVSPVTRVELVAPDGTIKPIEGAAHPSFPLLLRMAQARDATGYHVNIFLSGEASSGKTAACRMLAKAMELPWHFNGAISMPHEMLGFIDAAGHYHRTPFREAYEFGGVYTFDEVDRSDPVALLAVNPHLANGVATFPDGQITRHKDCIIICTANTWGGGGTADYCGATKLDAAFLSRFPARLAWDIDKALETTISGNAAWCARVQEARAKAQAAGLKVMIDVRMTLAGAALIAAGLTMDEASEATYLANLTPAQRKLVS